MLVSLHKIKNIPFHYIMEWALIFILLFAVQPNIAQANTCLDEMQHMGMEQHILPCPHDVQNKTSNHSQSNQMSDCCDLGLSAWSFSSPPKFYQPINRSIHVTNIVAAYNGLKLDVLNPPPRYS